MKDFNINEYIAVQLTDAGRAEHKRQHDELKKVIPKLGEYTPPKEDDNGWSKWQAWSLMNTFGHMVRPAFDPPFSTMVRIDI